MLMQAIGSTAVIITVGTIIYILLKAIKQDAVNMIVIVLCGLNIVSVWLDVIVAVVKWFQKIGAIIGV